MTTKRVSPAEALDASLRCIQQRKATVEDCLRSYPDSAGNLKPLLETAVRLQHRMVPSDPSPEYLAASEARLRYKLRASAPAGAGRAAVPIPIFGRGWIRAAAVILMVAVLLVSGGGVAVASARSIPGDTLYPAKRGLEQARLALSWTAAGDVSLLAQYSDERLYEVQECAQAGREADLLTGLEEYEKTLGLLDNALQRLAPNSDGELLDGIQTRLAHQAEILDGLVGQVPPTAQIELARAIDHSGQSQGLIQSLRENNIPGNPPPGQEKKGTKESGNPTPDKGKPSRTRETPVQKHTPNQPTKKPKTH
jgi:hypothetical protein